jgi:hypothetical protein
MKLQKLGGYAAIGSAALFVFVMVLRLQLGKHASSMDDPTALVSSAPVNFYAVTYCTPFFLFFGKFYFLHFMNACKTKRLS